MTCIDTSFLRGKCYLPRRFPSRQTSSALVLACCSLARSLAPPFVTYVNATKGFRGWVPGVCARRDRKSNAGQERGRRSSHPRGEGGDGFPRPVSPLRHDNRQASRKTYCMHSSPPARCNRASGDFCWSTRAVFAQMPALFVMFCALRPPPPAPTTVRLLRLRETSRRKFLGSQPHERSKVLHRTCTQVRYFA